LSRLWEAKWFWPLATLVLLLLYNLFFTRGFFAVEVKEGHLYGSLIDVLNRAVPVMLVSLGMTLVIATKGVDLSVGAIVSIAGALAAWIVTTKTTNLTTVVAAALVLSVLLGAWNGLLVSVFGVQPMVATLILMVSGRGVAQLITDSQTITFQHKGLAFFGTGYFLGLPFGVTLLVVMLALTAAATRWTAMGLFVESVGENETASRFSGIDVRTVKMFVYVFSGLCAGVAGLVFAGNIQAADPNNAGLNLELDAILAVVIGGTSMNGGRFYLLGSIIGALIMQTLTTMMYARNVQPEQTLVVKAIAVLVVCLIQSPELRAMVFRRREPA
jgi:simple sugar transport system permease protein